MGFQDILNRLSPLRANLPSINLVQAKVDSIPIAWTGLRSGAHDTALRRIRSY
jgi:hypothetical protein